MEYIADEVGTSPAMAGVLRQPPSRMVEAVASSRIDAVISDFTCQCTAVVDGCFAACLWPVHEVGTCRAEALFSFITQH